MYFDTSYRNSGASALVNYIEKDYPLRNSAGREITQREANEFVEKSKQHQFERELQIAPNPYADVSRSELERETRRMIGEFADPAHSSVRAVYAIHDDNGVLHSHVALTGKRRDLFMDVDDISQTRDRLEQRLEPDLGPAPELKQQIKLEQERKQRLEQGPKHEWELATEQGIEHELSPELKHEQEQEQEQEQSQKQEQSQDYDFF
jgi:hypothetical protein